MQHTSLVRGLKNNDCLEALRVPDKDLRLDVHFPSSDQAPEWMLRNARDLHLVALIERLVHLGGIEQDRESAGEIDYLLLADLVDRVVLGLRRHGHRVWIYHSSQLSSGIPHSLHVVIHHARQNLVQSRILLPRKPHALHEGR